MWFRSARPASVERGDQLSAHWHHLRCCQGSRVFVCRVAHSRGRVAARRLAHRPARTPRCQPAACEGAAFVGRLAAAGSWSGVWGERSCAGSPLPALKGDSFYGLSNGGAKECAAVPAATLGCFASCTWAKVAPCGHGSVGGARLKTRVEPTALGSFGRGRLLEIWAHFSNRKRARVRGPRWVMRRVRGDGRGWMLTHRHSSIRHLGRR